MNKTQQEKKGVPLPEISEILTSFKKKPLRFLIPVFIAFFWSLHLYLPFVEPEVEEALKVLNNTREQIRIQENEIIGCSDDFIFGLISREEFTSNVEILKIDIKEFKVLEFSQKESYDQIAQNAKISGFPSTHKFIYNLGLGLILIGLCFELFSSIKKYKGDEKRAKKWASVTYGTLAGFFMAWVFYPDNDLPPWAYKTVLLAIGFSVALFAHFFVKVKGVTIARIKDDFLTYLKRLKHGEIRALLKTAIAKDLYDDVYQDELKNRTKAIDKSIKEKANSIIYETNDSDT